MGRTYDSIDDSIQKWLAKQPMFFIATAPNDPNGRVNVSPKGGAGVFRVLGPHTMAYVDLVGSGAETVAHLQENGRIVVMFCAFTGAPKIMRFHGTGRSIPEDAPEYPSLLAGFTLDDEQRPLARGIVQVEVTRISDSCGFGVPRMEMVSERDQLLRWSRHQEESEGPDWKARYMAANNTASIDGLPGYDIDRALDNAEVAALSSEGRAL
ncbi:MAG: pyridoxamine 5'-phosphate oxidase family protein [Thermomicrobiales bacterium]|nr:pyridoxamine 5'-phosphate oxidase family protein [Thermomicrobiales bacterium]